MADKKADAKPDAPPAEAPSRKGRGLPIKTIAVVLALMVLEAAGVVLVLSMTGPKPSEGATSHTVVSDLGEQTQEILVVDDRFQNLQTGKVWLWDAAIYVQVKAKNADAVTRTLERRNAEIKEGISQIFSRAQHAQLKEPERQTLNRQLALLFGEIFRTPDNHPLIERVLIPNCRGYPADL